MNWKNKFPLVAALVCLALPGAMAQTNVTSTTQPNRLGTTVEPEKLTATDVSDASNLRPTRTERQKLPPEVLARIERFKREARLYLNKQEELKKQLQGVNDRERAEIREKLKALRDQWLEQAREFRQELRERQRELVNKLPDYKAVIDAARAAAAAQAADSVKDTHPRKGQN